jgi:hypothetical protein
LNSCQLELRNALCPLNCEAMESVTRLRQLPKIRNRSRITPSGELPNGRTSPESKSMTYG